MAKKQTPIRWLKRDNAKVAKAVKRANAKIRRLNDKGFDIEPLSTKEIKKTIATRKDFNKLLKEVDQFVARGSEKGKKKEYIWGFEKTYQKARYEAREKEKAKKLDEYLNEPVYSRGQFLGLRKEQSAGSRFMDSHEAELQPTKFDTSSRKNFNSMTQSINRFFNPKVSKAQDNRYKANFIKGIRSQIGDPVLERMIAMIPAEEIVRLGRQETEFNIDFVYEGHAQELKKETLREIIAPVFKEYRDNKMAELKRKGTPEDVLKLMRNLDDDSYAATFVSNIEEYVEFDTMRNPHRKIKYTTFDNEIELKRIFGIK